MISILLVAVPFLLTIAITPLIIYLSGKLNLIDYPDTRKIHEKPTPFTGSIAILLAIVITLSAFVKTNFITSYDIIIQILLLCALGFLGGFLDDLKDLRAFKKILIQLIISFFALYFGFKVNLSNLKFIEQYPYLCLFLESCSAIAIIILITNAFNILDYFDGGCSGVSLILAVSGTFLLGYLADNQEVRLLTLILAGALSGFLIYNFPRAKIFLGNGGSQFLGLFFSLLTLRIFFIRGIDIKNIAIFCIFFSYPIFEVVNAIFLRIKEKQAIFKADNRHFFYILTRAGINRKMVLFMIYLLNIEAGLLSVIAFSEPSSLYFISFAIIICISYVLIFISTYNLYTRGRVEVS